MSPEEVAQLAFCADKYNIQRLVGKAAKRLKPTSAEDIFPAFRVVMYIKCPDLELKVTKIIQQETDKIVQNKHFLELDENCILFIVKQSMLNISELQLWNNLVRWAESQVLTHPEKALRSFLDRAIPNIRLNELNSEEIAKHVVPTVLTQEEYIDLTVPRLYNLQEVRVFYKEYQKYIFKPQARPHEMKVKFYSAIKIETTKRIEIDTFKIKSAKIKPNDSRPYKCINIACHAKIYTSSEGLLTPTGSVTLSETVAPNETVTLPIKNKDGQSLILESNKVYFLEIQTSPPLPVHLPSMFRGSFPLVNTSYGMTVTYEDYFHIMEMVYRVLE